MSNGYVYGRGRDSFNISESDIRYAMENTKSNAAAARFMRVSYETWRKYSSMYTDRDTGKTLFELHKNQIGLGISKDNIRAKSSRYTIDALLEGKYPEYPVWKLRNRILALDILSDKCNCCGYDEVRITDGTVPLLLDFLDGDETNHRIENLQMLCLNCYYQQSGNPFNKDKEYFWNYNLMC
jgi:hypothetical protein